MKLDQIVKKIREESELLEYSAFHDKESRNFSDLRENVKESVRIYSKEFDILSLTTKDPLFAHSIRQCKASSKPYVYYLKYFAFSVSALKRDPYFKEISYVFPIFNRVKKKGPY